MSSEVGRGMERAGGEERPYQRNKENAMAIGKVVKVSNPALFDRCIVSLQDGLAKELPWLDHVFGRAERLVKEQGGVRRYTPNIYLGGDEYLLLLPDQDLGNFCFFVLDDPEDVQWNVGERSRLQGTFSLVVWVDMRTVDDDDTRNTERVKAQILRALNGGIWVRSGSISVAEIYSRAENVFAGFSLDEIDNQFLMSPYAGFRLQGEILAIEECSNQ